MTGGGFAKRVVLAAKSETRSVADMMTILKGYVAIHKQISRMSNPCINTRASHLNVVFLLPPQLLS